MKRLILAGGGHAHVEVLRRFALECPRDARITLINTGEYAPYSGMLPGLIAGHYRFEDCHIHLPPLAARAGVEWVDGEITALDVQRRALTLADGRTLGYALLSINCGSIPAAQDIAGVREHAIAVKPVAGFLTAWQALRERVLNGVVSSIGAGAAGVEVLLAMRHAIGVARPARQPAFTLITDTPHILPRHPAGVRRMLMRNLERKNITVRTSMRVSAVTASAIVCDQETVAADTVIWATGAAPLGWLVDSGLALSDAKFINKNNYLQSLSDSRVFAAGDCATLQGAVYPKSGVYAVRQGPVLAANLARALRGEPLTTYTPQPRALALISTGEQHAIASWGAVSFHGNWVWRWKDRIDRAFVAKYNAY
jgi:selenide,water dikinase